MRITVLFFVLLVGGLVGVFFYVADSSASEIEVLQKYFEHSRNQDFDSARDLWIQETQYESGSPVPDQDESSKEIDFNSVFWAEKVFKQEIEVLEFERYPKSLSSSVLCVSARRGSGIQDILRIRFSRSSVAWRISNIDYAEEDPLKIYHKDCINFGKHK